MRWLIAIVAIFAVSASSQPFRHDRIFVVPAPKRVVIDGDLRDWDLSAAITCVFDEALQPRFTVTVAAMYDSQALYISAHFVDDTPMLNRHDPAIEPNKGWDGDALQVRLCSDPKAPYPLPDMESDRVCHLTMWFFTDKQLPVCTSPTTLFARKNCGRAKNQALPFARTKAARVTHWKPASLGNG